MEQLLIEIGKHSAMIRDIGIILGLPTMIVVFMHLYKQQINTLKTEIELLKQTQYDKALLLLDSQKKLYHAERDELESKIKKLESERDTKDDDLNALQEKYNNIEAKEESIVQIIHSLNKRQQRSGRHLSYLIDIERILAMIDREVDFVITHISIFFSDTHLKAHEFEVAKMMISIFPDNVFRLNDMIKSLFKESNQIWPGQKFIELYEKIEKTLHQIEESIKTDSIDRDILQRDLRELRRKVIEIRMIASEETKLLIENLVKT